jgi:glucosyl-3-phosphoglycerate synthase
MADCNQEMRTFHHSEFTSTDALVQAKIQGNVSISLVIPALNEAATIGSIVSTVRAAFMHGRKTALIDEIVVIDGCSQDATRVVAEKAGARVVAIDDAGPQLPMSGKGAALWKSQFVTTGDVVVFIDADIANFSPHFITGLVGPLLLHPDLYFVKSFYRRPLVLDERLYDHYGGRITEIMVRPLLNALMPELSFLRQPLSGEYALRRSVMEELPFSSGYGVEIGLLFDFYERYGVEHLAQVDIEMRIHRNRPVTELGAVACGITQVMLRKLGQHNRITFNAPTVNQVADASSENIEIKPRRVYNETGKTYG